MLTDPTLINPGDFELENHFYPRVLNAHIHPLVRNLMEMGNDRISSRFCHLHPEVDAEAVKALLQSVPKYFRWGGCDLFHVTSEEGNRSVVVIETNSCPSGQKSMPRVNESLEQAGYERLLKDSFLEQVRKRKGGVKGDLAVLYDKNHMENSGYAATLAELTQKKVWLVPFHASDVGRTAEFENGVLYVLYNGERIPIRAAFRYVTQQPWNRIPPLTKTLIYNPVLVCLAGGRITLCRRVPVRVPSEVREFTWDDVDWDNNQILIHSPKTRRIGKSARLVPIFPDVRKCLEELMSSDETAKGYVFSKLRKDTNPGTMAKKIVRKAEVDPWKNFFNSLRATAETDLMDEYGLRRACQWAGNSAGTAMKNYALVKKTDFTDSGTNITLENVESNDQKPAPKCDAKSDAINDFDAKSDAESSSTDSHEFASNQVKNALPQNHLEGQCVLVDDIGLEPTTSSMSTRRSSQLS